MILVLAEDVPLFVSGERIVVGELDMENSEIFSVGWKQVGWKNIEDNEIVYEVLRPNIKSKPYYEWFGPQDPLSETYIEAYNLKHKLTLKRDYVLRYLIQDDKIQVIEGCLATFGESDIRPLSWSQLKSVCREIGTPIINVTECNYTDSDLIKIIHTIDDDVYIRSYYPKLKDYSYILHGNFKHNFFNDVVMRDAYRSVSTSTNV